MGLLRSVRYIHYIHPSIHPDIRNLTHTRVHAYFPTENVPFGLPQQERVIVHRIARSEENHHLHAFTPVHTHSYVIYIDANIHAYIHTYIHTYIRPEYVQGPTTYMSASNRSVAASH